MFEPTSHSSESITALELRRLVAQLQEERSLALDAGLGSVTAYMADLDEELEHRRHLYVATAITEIATLRGELFGPQVG